MDVLPNMQIDFLYQLPMIIWIFTVQTNVSMANIVIISVFYWMNICVEYISILLLTLYFKLVMDPYNILDPIFLSFTIFHIFISPFYYIIFNAFIYFYSFLYSLSFIWSCKSKLTQLRFVYKLYQN